MEKKRGQIVRILAFLLIGAALFWAVQAVLTPSWTWPYYKESPVNTLAELAELENGSIQAVFLGTSHPCYGISPMRIYEQSGIATYNLATSSQPMDLGYHMLVECFKTQSPQYVFLDAMGLFPDSFKDAKYRYVLDTMPLSENKIALAQTYAEHYKDEKQTGTFLSAFFPIYRYHDRWEELGEYDFNFSKQEKNYYLKGYYMVPTISGSSVTVEKMNSIAEINATSEGWIEQIENGQIERTPVDGMVYAPEIDQEAEEILLRIKDFCTANGAQLRLIKTPTCIRPQNAGAWTRIRYDLVKELSEQYEIPYLDFTYDVDAEINWKNDTLDGGSHLNYSGAKKVSDFFAEYLQTECGLEGQTDAEYEADLPLYRALCTVAELQMTTDLTAYLKKVSEMEDVTVFLSAMDDMMRNLSEENRQDLKDFGLRTDFNKLVYSDSYLGIKEGDTVLYEASGNRRLSRSGELANGVSYTVTSCGWRAGAVSSIKLDGVEYSMNKRGINIVVLDDRSGLVLDSVVFDTWNDGSQSGVRSTSSTTKYSPMGSSAEQAYFFAYEDHLLKNGL